MAQLLYVDRRKSAPPCQQRRRAESSTGEGPQFGDRTPVHGDRECLSVRYTLQHPTTIVSQFSNGDVVHTP